MPKAMGSTAVERQARRHNPLAEDYSPTTPQLKQKASKKRKHTQQDDEDEQSYIDSKPSNRILRHAQEQVEEEQEGREREKPNPAFAFESVLAGVDAGEDEGERTFEDDNDEEAWGDDDEIVEEIVGHGICR